MDVLGVRIDEVTLDQAKAKIFEFLGESRVHRIFTPNPEILVAATRNPGFSQILNTADLSLCDGRGVELFGKGKFKRIPGVDFMLEILKIAEKEQKSVFFLGSGKTKTLKKLFESVQLSFPNLQIAGMHPGPKFYIDKGAIRYKNALEQEINSKVLEDIRMNGSDIVFVAFGHEKQEIWIDTYASSLSRAHIAMGVGGSFDYISGSVKRAPQWLRKLGLEWLYRFFTQPKRLIRIITATIIFPYYAFTKNR